MSDFDTVIIGAGHNGLVCAATLAKAGHKVLVLEAADTLGGAAKTETFHPGFQVSTGAHLLNLLDPQVKRSLNLSIESDPITSLAIAPDGAKIGFDAQRAWGDLSADDAAGYSEVMADLIAIAKVLAAAKTSTPPRLGEGLSKGDLLRLGGLGLKLKGLGKKRMREALRIILMNAADLLDEHLEGDLLKGAVGFDAILSTHLGPRSPGSVLTLLYRLSEGGTLSLPKGGMGAVTSALAGAAEKAGAEIRTSSPVAQVLVEGDRACGVVLASSERISARCVVSNADPKTSFLKLVGARHLDAGFCQRVEHLRANGNVAKLHLALEGLPDSPLLNPEELKQRLVLSDPIDAMEEAFNPAKYGRASARPLMEVVLPSLHDASLAPSGGHVLSAAVTYAPFHMKEGWEAARDAFKDRAIARLAEIFPKITAQIKGAELLTPLDLQQRFGMSGGHWHHGELTVDQLLFLRPVPGAAQYSTPLSGFYLCGAGCHPGGGISGRAGLNAAKRLIEMEAS